jgi:hypothetical protein
MSGARRATGQFTALAAAALVVLAMAAPAAGGQGGQGGQGAQEPQKPRLPRELWKAYPLYPTEGETGEPSVGSGGAATTEPRPPAATNPAPVSRETPQADGGAAAAVALAAALGGLAGLLAVGFAVVIARRRGRLLPRLPRLRRAAVMRGALGSARSVPALAVVPARRLANAVGTLQPPRPRMRPVEAPPKEEPTPSAPEAALAAAAPRPLYAAGQVEPRRPTRRMAGARGRVEECEIEWWRGYVVSDFYAFALRPGGTTTVLTRSSSFPWRRTDPPPADGPAAEAHAVLVERLSAQGWESVGTGGAWYRTQMRRRLKPELRDFANPAGRGAG